MAYSQRCCGSGPDLGLEDQQRAEQRAAIRSGSGLGLADQQQAAIRSGSGLGLADQQRAAIRSGLGLGLADQQRAATFCRQSNGPSRASEAVLRARAALREQLGSQRTMTSFNRCSPLPSDDEEPEDPACMIKVGNLTATFVLPPERAPREIGAELPPALKRKRDEPHRGDEAESRRGQREYKREKNVRKDKHKHKHRDKHRGREDKRQQRIGSGQW